MYAAEPLPLAGLELAPGNRIDLDLVVPATPPASASPSSTALPALRFPSPSSRSAGTRSPPLTSHLRPRRTCHGGRWPTSARPMRESPSMPGWVDRTGSSGRWAARSCATTATATTITGRLIRCDAGAGRSSASSTNRPASTRCTYTGSSSKSSRATVAPSRRGTGAIPCSCDARNRRRRARPSRPGLWMLHCHILEHAESGMMTLVEVVR